MTLNADVCPNCHVTILEYHPELPKWKKCSICGYCEKQEEPSDYSKSVNKMLGEE